MHFTFPCNLSALTATPIITIRHHPPPTPIVGPAQTCTRREEVPKAVYERIEFGTADAARGQQNQPSRAESQRSLPWDAAQVQKVQYRRNGKSVINVIKCFRDVVILGANGLESVIEDAHHAAQQNQRSQQRIFRESRLVHLLLHQFTPGGNGPSHVRNDIKQIQTRQEVRYVAEEESSNNGTRTGTVYQAAQDGHTPKRWRRCRLSSGQEIK